MRALAQQLASFPSPEALAAIARAGGGQFPILLRTALFTTPEARYSYFVANPFLTFRAHGPRCELTVRNGATTTVFGNPWDQLQLLLSRYEILDEIDLPFPIGGCFGFFGYDLKNFVEPKLGRRTIDDLDLPDCFCGFYSSMVVFDHFERQITIISTGLKADGSRSQSQAESELNFWREKIELAEQFHADETQVCHAPGAVAQISSNITRAQYESAVERALEYIRRGEIYQVNLAQRLSAPIMSEPWDFYLRLIERSPAPFSAFLDGGDFQLISASPERFLRLSGAHIQTRPIKGTRPRDPDPTRDAQLTYELQTSAKEMAELVMITDLLRNDLGRVCEFGSVHVPELVRLERYPQVQHLVSTVEGRLRSDVTHLRALAQCFPGGSISGAPKFRAMQIIDELENVARGPYTGALGYLGFNRESQFSILIRTAIVRNGFAYYHAGSGIVADSDPTAEYHETLAKAAGFIQAIEGAFAGEKRIGAVSGGGD
jgi:para-aminobenzoate synthetase component 1